MTSNTAVGQGRTAAGRAAWFIDPLAIMQIKNLSLRAKTVVEGFAAGLHRSPLRGFSVEFAEYRPYALGDDPRSLDWKLLARTDRYYVKQYEDETNRRCYLAVDQSRSMEYGNGQYSKAEYARTLAATLAYYFHMQRDAVGIMTCGVQESDYLPPRFRSGHLQQIMHLLGQESQGTHSDLSQALVQLANLSRRRGLVVLISDFLTDPQSLLRPLGYLRGRGHEVLLLRVLDQTEINLTLPHSSLLRDLESGREMFIDPATAQQDYRRRFESHQRQLVDICHRRGAGYRLLTLDQPLDTALLELIGNSQPRSARRELGGTSSQTPASPTSQYSAGTKG